jgi:hypothetical protein
VGGHQHPYGGHQHPYGSDYISSGGGITKKTNKGGCVGDGGKDPNKSMQEIGHTISSIPKRKIFSNDDEEEKT